MRKEKRKENVMHGKDDYLDKIFHYRNMKVERSKEDTVPIFLWNLLQY